MPIGAGVLNSAEILGWRMLAHLGATRCNLISAVVSET